MRLYQWNEAKNSSNIARHGVDFALMDRFDWDSAVVVFDDAHEEPRWVGRGTIAGVLHVVVFAELGEQLRIISLRRANAKEKRTHAQEEAAY